METAQSDGPMDADALLDADTQILDVLRGGRSTKGMLVDETDFSRNTVYNRLEVLEASGHIQLVHDGTRLFELVDDPRGDTGTQDAPQEDADVEGMQARIDTLEARVDDLRAENERLRELDAIDHEALKELDEPLRQAEANLETEPPDVATVRNRLDDARGLVSYWMVQFEKGDQDQ